MYVIIIAGSLPTLRPLAQKAFAMSKSRSSSQKGLHQYPHPDRHSHPLKPYSIKISHYRSDAPARESESDQNILQSGITKVTDIAIDYDTRNCEIGKGQKEWESGGDDAMGTVTNAVGPVERV